MAMRLLIADDHPVVRSGLKALFEPTQDIQVVGEAADGRDVMRLLPTTQPQVLLMDVRMPGIDGLSCLTKIQSEATQPAVLILSAYDNPTYLGRAKALGAAGYLNKSSSTEKIVSSVRQVAAGESLWKRENTRRLAGRVSTVQGGQELETPLTKREGEVLGQLSLGLSNKEIAQALGISYETVKEHVQHILRKLGVSDRTQAAVWAVRAELAMQH